MKLNSSNVFFLLLMIMGTVMCLCSNNWLFIWCGLELSLISFIPLMMSKLMVSSESSMKYFLIQSVSSAILILGLMSMVMMKSFYDSIVLLSILIKMGVAPFHLWLLSLVEGLQIMPMVLMFTLTKVAPLMMLTFINLSISLIITLTMMVGSIMGVNQSSTRKMIAYSSIFNMGLMLISIKNNFIWFYYLMIYSLLLMMMLFMIYKLNMFYVNQTIMNEEFLINKLTFWLTLLSMGGLPPFLGFSIKLIVIEYSIDNMMIFNLIAIIMFSLLVMFFYLRMCYLSMMFFSVSQKWSLLSLNKMSVIMMAINIVSLPLFALTKIFY